MTCQQCSFETLHVQALLSFTLTDVTFTEDSCYHAGEINPLMNNKYYNFACDPTDCASASSLDIKVFDDTDCTHDITSTVQRFVGKFSLDVAGLECGTCDNQQCSEGQFTVEVPAPATEAPEIVDEGTKEDAGGFSTDVTATGSNDTTTKTSEAPPTSSDTALSGTNDAEEESGDDKVGLSTEILIVIIVGAVCLLGCIVVGAWKNKKEKSAEQEQRSKFVNNGAQEQNKGNASEELLSDEGNEIKIFVP